MPPHPDHEALRFETFARDVLGPAAIHIVGALDAAAFTSSSPLSWHAARTARYEAVPRGWRFGPAWSTTWFRLRGPWPTNSPGLPILSFDCGTEALLWHDGVPWYGFGPNHHWAPLPSRPGHDVELHVEAACNLPLGATTFWWDDAELAARWNEALPGRLATCACAILDERIWHLEQRYRQAIRLLEVLPREAARHRRVLHELHAATDALPDDDLAQGYAAARRHLDAALATDPLRAATTCVAVGHAHIDTGWLWPVEETPRKCLRSWATALALMDRDPSFTFTATQPQQYAWVQDASPALFDRIRARVAEGRWEVSGATWVEPDCLLVSGESLVRQITHAARWNRAHLGVDPPRTLFLPDTFGFPACLPTIMAAAGIDTFVTNKLAWSEVNVFPYVTFTWVGPDGSAVRAQQTPGHDYNATLVPDELARGERHAVQDEVAPAEVWLQPFGFGDGGGGPTAEMLARLGAPAEAAGLPRVAPGTIASFRKRLAETFGALPRGTWRGPLDLEMHRGTLTSHAAIKWWNVEAESMLRSAELMSVGAGAAPDLDEAWKRTLLHQFHDILPGTSIGPVYERARTDHDVVRDQAQAALDAARAEWAAQMRGDAGAIMVCNATSTARSGVVEHGERLLYATDVPAFGARVITGDAAVAPVRAEPTRLANGIVEARFDARGRLVHLSRAGAASVVGAPGADLHLYEDRPRRWEAWDIDAEYVRKPIPWSDEVSIEARGDDALVGTIAVRRATSASRPRLVWRLDAGSPCLLGHVDVDGQDRRRLLRLEVPLAFQSDVATCAGPLGFVTRPTHGNTSWERARFEIPASGWVDLAHAGEGLSLIARSSFGYSLAPSRVGLSLLRAPDFPDRGADRGPPPPIAFGLLPHAGDWRAAGTPAERDALRSPLTSVEMPPNATGARGDAWAPLTLDVDGAAQVEVTACKPADDDSGDIVVRLSERGGGNGTLRLRWHVPVRDTVTTDLHETPLADARPQAGADVVMPLQAHALLTLRARRGAAP